MNAISANWRIPVLIFQTCDNYDGYTCIKLIDAAFSKTGNSSTTNITIRSSSPLRKIVSLHIRGEAFNYLQSSDVVLDNQGDSFNSKTRSILGKMK